MARLFWDVPRKQDKNPLNLAKHEIAEMLADADEVAVFLDSVDVTGIIDVATFFGRLKPEVVGRWAESIRKLSRMVEIE